jgi:hypothetical protein
MLEPFDDTPEPAGHAPGPGPAGRPDPQPVIVIEYRQRGFASRLMPPALILLAALAISSYQRRTPVRPIAPRIDLKALAQQKHAEPEPPSPPTKVIFRPDTPEPEPDAGEAPTVAAVERPRAAAPASPFDLDPASGLEPVMAPAPPGPDRDLAAAAAATPEPVSPPDPIPAGPAAEDLRPGPDGAMAGAGNDVSREDILRDIRREADEEDARRDELERLKPRAQALLMAEAVARTNDSRIPFRNELRQLLLDLGDNAGGEIDRLCDTYGRDLPPEVRAAYYRTLRRAPSRMSRQASIDLMRSAGLPEPVILDYLAHGLHKTINTRGGPRDADQVRVLAARALLSVPVSNGRKPAPKGTGSPAPSNGFATFPARPVATPRALPR